jgi:hypothetical protein
MATSDAGAALPLLMKLAPFETETDSCCPISTVAENRILVGQRILLKPKIPKYIAASL